MPYSPTPMVNFQYEPEKTDIRRLLDSQEKIKKESQADQTFEMDLANAQQAYELGAMKIKEAQMKTDEIMRAKQLDDDSSKMYQSVIMSGGTEADAFRATKALRAKNGGWALMQQDMEAEHEMLTKAMSMAKLSPALAEKAASLINSNLSPGSPMMTGAQLYEMQNRKDPVKLDEKGNFIFWELDPTTGKSTPIIKNFQSPEMAEAAAIEQKNKERGFALEQGRIGATYAGYNAQLEAAKLRADVDREQMASAERIAELGKEKALESIEKKGEEERKKQVLVGVQKLDQIAAKGGVDMTLAETRGEINKAMQEEKLKMQDKWKGLDVGLKEKSQKILQDHYKATEALGRDTLELKRLEEKNDVADNDRKFELSQKVKEHRMKMDEAEYKLDKFKAESTRAAKAEELKWKQENAEAERKVKRERIQAIKQKQTSVPVSPQGKAMFKQAEKAMDDVVDAEEFASRVRNAKPSAIAELMRAKGMAPSGDAETDRQRAEKYAETVRARALRATELLGQYDPETARNYQSLFGLSGASGTGTASGTSGLYNAPWMK
jgi:hypothetical protein